MNKKDMKLVRKAIEEEGYYIIGTSQHSGEIILYLKEKKKDKK